MGLSLFPPCQADFLLPELFSAHRTVTGLVGRIPFYRLEHQPGDLPAHLVVLVTSRTLLALSGEHRCEVRPLGLPTASSGTATDPAPAVRLFIARARAVRPDFELTDPGRVTWSAGQVRGPRCVPVRIVQGR